MSNPNSSYQFTSSITNSLKRDALWNIIEPGDPYDIRKSMIAKVPGDKKNFMGDHLELVCLFQAAEIERLCEFLEDFRQKHRQIERLHLDRHSYEIQIKELNHRLAQENSFREENQKLKEFLKNQNSSRVEVQDSIKTKYEKLLLQYKAFQDENFRIRRDNENMVMQISSFDAKFEALRKSKQIQIDQMYTKWSQQSSMTSQMQLQSLHSQYESQVQRLDLENKRIKQLNEQKSRQIESWHEKYRSLEQQLIRSSQPRNDLIKYERQIAQYQNRYVIFGQEIDRLNLVVKDMTVKYEMAEQKSRDLESRLTTINREYTLLQSKSSTSGQEVGEYVRRITELETENRRLQESGRYSQELQSKLRFSNEQINRLTTQLRLQNDTSSRLKNDLQKYQYQGSKVNILQKQLYEYKQTASENNSLKQRLAKTQNQVLILKQQIDRLKQELSRKGGIDLNYQQLAVQYERLQRSNEQQTRKIQITIQEYQTRIAQTRQEYEHRIQVINRTQGNEFQSKASMLQSELQRLGDILKRRNEQLQALQRQLRQAQSTMSQSQYQVQRKVQTYESSIQTLRRQNQELLRRVRQLQPLQRKVSQTQNKILITTQELDRLNQQLRQKQTDIDNMRRQIRQQQIAIVQRFQMDTSRKIGSYEQSLSNLSRQHEELKRKYVDLQSKTALLSLQIERLMTKMKQLQHQNTQYEHQNQRLQKVVRETQLSITSRYEFQVNQKVANYETALRNNQAQSDTLKRRLGDMENGNENLKRKMNQLQAVNQTLKRRILELQNSNKKLIQYENALQQLSRQLQRVSGALKHKQDEFAHLENNYRTMARQAQETNRKYLELQTTVKNKYEVQVTRTVTTLQQNIAAFTRENTELKRYLQDYEGKLHSQQTQYERLTLNLRNSAQQNQQLKRQLRQFQTMVSQKMQVQVSNNYRSYQTTIQTMKRDLQAMKRDLQNLLRENTQLKRLLQLSQQSTIKLKQQYEDMRRKHQQQSGDVTKRFGEYDVAVNKLHSQNQGLRRKIVELENAIRHYEAQAGRKISTLDQTLGSAARQNQQLKRRLEQTIRQSQEMRKLLQNLERDKQQLGRRLRQSSDFNKKIPEYENALALISQQHQRTMQILKAKSQQLIKAQEYINELSNKFNAQQRNIVQSQTSIQQFESSVKTQITQYQQNITVITQENNQIKRKLSESHNKIAEYENKIVVMTQQLQRLNLNIRNQVQKQNHLENTLRASSGQNEQLRRKIAQLQNTITQRYQVQATRNIKALEQNIEHLQKQGQQLKTYLSEYQQRFNAQNVQIQKYNANIRALTQENAMIKNQLKETQIQFTRRYETEVTAKYSAYEREITNTQRENEQLIRKLKEYAQRVIPEYENKVAILRQEIQRLKHQLSQQSGQLGNNLKLLGQQNEQLKRQLQQLHGLKQRQDLQTQQQFTVLQQNLTHLQKQNQELKKYIKQIGGQYQGLGQNLTHMQKENEDLKRSLQQTYGKYESQAHKTGSVARQNQQLKRRLQQMQQQIQRLIKKLNQFSQQNQAIKRQSKQSQMQIIQRFQSQTTQQINIYKQQINQLQVQWKTSQQQAQQLQRRYTEVGSDASRKVTQLSAQIQKLNQVIRDYQTKLRQALHDNQLVHRKMKENQIQITQKWQMEFRNKINVYEQNIQAINKTVQERQRQIYQVNNRRIAQLQNKVVLLSQQIQRLNNILKNKNEQSEKMRFQIQRLNNTLRLKLQESKQYQIQLSKFRTVTQTQFAKLQESYSLVVRENQNYKKHMSEYENKLKKVYGQFERLQNIINDYKNQRESIFDKNNGLVREIERLTLLNKDLQVNVEEVNLKLTDQAALQRRVKEHMALMVILFAEIESLRKRIKDKERQVQDVRRSSLAPFKLQTRPRNDSV